MAIVLVATHANEQGSTAVNSPVLTHTSVAGNLLVLWIGHVNNSSNTRVVSSVTDNVGNTYTQAPGAAAQSANGTWRASSDIWYCQNCLGGATNLTVTFSGTEDNTYVGVIEYSGARLSGVLDTATNLTGGGPALGAAITPTVSGELLVTGCSEGQYVIGTASTTPWVNELHSTDSGFAMADAINTALSSQQNNFAGGNGNTTPFDFAASSASFLPPASGPSGKTKGSMLIVA